MKTEQAAIAEFWDERASLEEQAGTRDLIAKQLEVEAISKYVKPGMRVLDAGCGNGLTAIELARHWDIEIDGFDCSPKMIDAAIKRLAAEPILPTQLKIDRDRVRFRIADVCDLPDDLGMFDLIYTERTLINLPDQEQREKAMVGLCNLLAPDGLYVMCENNQDALDRLNRWRAQLDLPEIVPPWHNHYLTKEDIVGFERAVDGLAFLARTDDYSATYYFLSRVVNAAIAAQEGREPDYNSPINRLALKLPSMGDLGQGRIWLWRRI